MNKKRLLSLLLIFTMVFSLIGCSDDDKVKEEIEDSEEVENETASFSPGVYEGISKGHNGEIKVSVELSEDEILDIEILEHSESPAVSDLALERIPADIIEDQRLKVDTISGATITSGAVMSAVKDAIESSGADIGLIDSKLEKEEIEQIEENLETDIVVIGGGGAGLAAAVSAHENGANVVLVEKMDQLGGNTVLSGGAYNAVDKEKQEAQGIEDSIEKHFEQTFDGGDKKADKDMVQTLVENANPARLWLEELGMGFEDEVFTVLGGLWPRAHKPTEPIGAGFIYTYEDYIENNEGIEVIFGTEATEIIMDNDIVTGIKAESKEKLYTIEANNGVIIATGGFANNPELREKYNTEWADLSDLKSTNHAGATGDGLILAEKVNANLIDLEDIQLLPMGDPATGSLSGNIETNVENRIFVNKSGERFVDEGARRDVMTKALLDQEDSSMWTIVDSHSYPTEDTVNNFNESIAELMEQGRAFKGETVEELAKEIDVDPEKLQESLDKFNACVESKSGDEFGRSLFQDKIDKGPFYAGIRVPTVHHTMGGIQINPKAEVLDIDGNIIKGLYAAGEVTGGIHGTNRLGGNALSDITVFGKIAGENAAKNK